MRDPLGQHRSPDGKEGPMAFGFRWISLRAAPLLGLILVASLNPGTSQAQQLQVIPGPVNSSTPSACVPIVNDNSESCFEIIRESLVGKLDKDRWRELTWDTFFSEGWNEA
ncbi:MAG: hypothetical protein ACKO23_07065, partial [Gemmataceae bacterium]